MRAALSLLALLLLIAVAAGCGEDEPKRSQLAEQLAALCDQARSDIEALGLPGDKGFAVVRPTAAIGLRLARQVGRLEGTTAHEREQVKSLAAYIKHYYSEVDAGAKIYLATRQSEPYTETVVRAKSFLVSAEALATRMGAPECSARPFAD
jgi:hypothetical protein